MTANGRHPKGLGEADDPEGVAHGIAASLEALPGDRRRLPFYLTIGIAGSGKTAALAAADMRLSASATPESGCHLWIGARSLAIEVAGRLATHDTPVDRQSWLALLNLLAANRSKWPVGGIIVAVNLEDVMTLTRDALDALAANLQKRVREARGAISGDLPAYVLFTKTDLIAGFGASVRRLDEVSRRKVWGATLDQPRRPASDAERLTSEFDVLVEQLLLETTDRMQDEPDAGARVAIFEFPRQFASLKDEITAFLVDMVDLDTDGSRISLRGFYFTSAGGDGDPIDHLSVGDEPTLRDGSPSTIDYRDGRAYFLGDLMMRHLPADFLRMRSGGRHWANTPLLRYGAIAATALMGIVLLSAWGVSAVANRALIKATDTHIEQHRAELAQQLGNPVVRDADLETIVEALTALRTLPAGHAESALPTPVLETFGLSQRAKLREAAERAYGQALQAQLRPRLILQAEQAVQARLTDPVALYEPLKAYLLLGGQAPVADNTLVTAWLARDWEENRYPGATNRAGRDELKAHLQAMLADEADIPPPSLLDGRLVEVARRSLARIALPDLAWAEIGAAARSAKLADFSVAERAGDSSSLVFEPRDGRNLGALRIAGLYTHAGFNEFLLPQLASVAQRIVDSQWVMGEGSQQLGMEQQLRRLGPELLDRYARDFLSAWNAMLDNLRLVSLTAGEDGRKALEALASSSSPLRMLAEAVAAETALTRGGFDVDEQVALAEGLARVGIDLGTAKSQNQAGSTSGSARGLAPGANVEAQFRPFRLLVDEGARRRPIDALVQNFAGIERSLVLAASAPGQADRVNANLQLQVHNLRVNASRLPRPLARMIEAAAEAFEIDQARASLEHLDTRFNEAITLPCEDLVTDAYPFAPDSTQDAALADFARIFAPGGEFDRFFALNLAPFADVSGTQWRWKPDARIARDLSQTTLRAFQYAAEIREAFFPQGGSTPAVELTITPFSLQGGAETAQLEVNGEVVNSYQAGNVPVTLTWPGPAPQGSAELILAPELPGRPNNLRFEGPWALMRLLATGTASSSGDDLQVQLLIGGRGATYTLHVDAKRNPFALPALSQFRCPVGL